jgi:Zn-dependent protease with chaperone function
MEWNAVQSIEHLSQLAAAAFVSSLWQGILLAVAVALCLRLMPKLTATVRFAVWSAVFLVILLLPFVHLWTGQSHATLVPSAAIFQIDVRWSYAIAAVWVLLSAVRAGKLAISAWHLHGIWKRATPVENVPQGLKPLILSDSHGTAKAVPFQSLGASRGEAKAVPFQSRAYPVSAAVPSRKRDEAVSPAIAGSRVVQLCTSAEVDRPSVIGFFSPRILIPAWLFEKLTMPELEQIVIHEIGHISRADDWINLFQKIGLVLFPLNPVLIWIDRRLCFERELACDDGVLQRTQAPNAYATCLVTLAERAMERRAASLSLGAWERQSELTRRVQSILRRRENMNRPQTRLALGVIALTLLGGAAGLSRCPHIVSFNSDRPIAELPPSMPVQALPAAEYRPVVFHPETAPHATLLKASVPVGPVNQPAQAIGHKPSSSSHTPARHPVSAPAVQRVKQASAGTQRLVVLTSWNPMAGNEPANPAIRPGMVLAVTDKHAYAALPTGDGWLVIQL